MPVTLSAPVSIEGLIAVGRQEGLAAGMRAILASANSVPRSATRLALVPAGTEPTHRTAQALPHPLADAAGLRLLRLAPPTTKQDPESSGSAALQLAAVRLGLVAALLDLATEHVNKRRVEGSPLVDKQLVQAVLAEADTGLALCRHALDTATTPAAVETLHGALAEIGWSLATLFGASGYLCDHPVVALYAADLVHDTWRAAR